jgi:Xaa-Pro aminopeptidase
MPAFSATDRAIFTERRARLAALMPPGSVALFPSAPVANRNNDVDHEYRQDSDLFYLTGFEEPESLGVLKRDDDGHCFEMVVRPKDREREIWDGRRAGVEGAVADYGADSARPTAELTQAVEAALAGRDVLVYALGAHPDVDPLVLKLMTKFRGKKRKAPSGPTTVLDIGPLVHEMRLFKSKREIEFMQGAADITVAAHTAAMRALKPGMNERAVQAVIEGTFRVMGSPRNGYPCIVAGGTNATILHYNENNQAVPAGGLLLIDAGAEENYYTADVTRTFPADGRFTEAQRAVYQVVLDAQLASIECTRPGYTVDDVHQASIKALTQGMVEIGLLEGDVDELIKTDAYKRYYMHGTGHWLGMDVHDVGDYKTDDKSRSLEPGMVMTVEPGLYIAVNDDKAPAQYRGIGVRIEDDVVVTEGAPLVLTQGCPKTVEAIERTMAESPQAPW